jgi:vacuolar-type H+-ATPase subunit E/Vma4
MTLEPLRASLLAQAHAEARSLVDAAGREADRCRAGARAEAAELVRQATADRDVAARGARDARLRRARQEARAIVLRARRDARDELRAAARSAAAGLRGEPGLGDRLAALAREQLGPEAELMEPAEGGMVARSGERLVDYSLPAMVDRCLAELGPELEELWR